MAVPRPKNVTVIDNKTGGELRFQYSNSSDFVAGDVIVVRDINGSIIGGGMATSGDFTIGGLTNTLITGMRLKTVRP